MKPIANFLHSVPLIMMVVARTLVQSRLVSGLNFVRHPSSSKSGSYRHSASSTCSFLQHYPTNNVASGDRSFHCIPSRGSTASNIPKSTSVLWISSSTSSSSPSITSGPVTIKSIKFIQEAVLEALNELFDPAEVARGAALAKLETPRKKKKQTRKSAPEDSEGGGGARPMSSS
jgi:hypothetical protein